MPWQPASGFAGEFCLGQVLVGRQGAEALVPAVDLAAADLLESLGEDVCDCLLEGFPVSKVTVNLRKLNLPFPNNLSYVEVCLTRTASI